MGRLAGDRVFCGYLGLAALLFSWHGAGAYRLRRELAELRPCLAFGDVPCAEQSFARARGMAPDDGRVLFAAAQLAALRGDPDEAEKALARAPGVGVVAATPAGLRAEALLARGDIAAARKKDDEALARWREAALLGDAATLVPPRARRMEQARALERETSDLRSGGVREAFEKLIVASRTGSRADAERVRRGVREAIAMLPPAKRASLERALVRAEDLVALGERRRAHGTGGAITGPYPVAYPRRPSEDEIARDPRVEDAWRRAVADYTDGQSSYESARAGGMQAHAEALQQIARSTERAVADVRAMVDGALQR